MPLPGFVLGHNFWMGSVQGCEAVQKPPPLTISNRFERFMHTDLWSATAPFDIGYRMVYAEHRSPWQVQVEFVLEKNVRNFKPVFVFLLLLNAIDSIHCWIRVFIWNVS